MSRSAKPSSAALDKCCELQNLSLAELQAIDQALRRRLLRLPDARNRARNPRRPRRHRARPCRARPSPPPAKSPPLLARRPMHTREAFLPDAERIHDLISSYSGDGTLLPRTLAEICENVRDFIVLEEARPHHRLRRHAPLRPAPRRSPLHHRGPELSETRRRRLLVQSLMSEAQQTRGQLHLPVYPHSRVLLEAGFHRRPA